MVLTTKLSIQGYSIYKKELTESDIKRIKNELTVEPFNYMKSEYNDTDDSFCLLKENEEKIYVPRFYGIEKFGIPLSSSLHKGKSIKISFTSKLRPIQKPIVESYFKNIDLKSNHGGGGLICAGCGVGKTVISLYICSKLKVKTLIIVHKEFLLNQWIERIKQFLNKDITIGTIQGKIIDTNKDIVIGMLQTVSKDKIKKDLLKDFGLVIYDECHHLGAKVFSKALNKTTFKYTLGLSATPDRKDGLTDVFLWSLGKIAFKQEKVEDRTVLVRNYKYYNDDETYCKIELNYKKQIMNPKIINNISRCEKRNMFIISLLDDLLKDKRKILILSERLEQIHFLFTKIKEIYKDNTVGKYIGKLKQDQLDQALLCDIIVGTYSMIEEGFDCKELNTLIMATPKNSIEQAVGRILRIQPEKRTIQPIVIDISDQFGNCIGKERKRKTHYRKLKYNIEEYNVNDNNETCVIEQLESKMKQMKIATDVVITNFVF
jgi:superfamily II DNA or RNA helicase